MRQQFGHIPSVIFGVLMIYHDRFQEINQVSPLMTTARYLPQVIGGLLVNLFAAYTLHIMWVTDNINTRSTLPCFPLTLVIILCSPGNILLIVGMISFTGSSLLFALQGPYITYWAMSFPSLCE